MKLDIVIPTYHRKNKLLDSVNSIERAKHNNDICLYIYYSDNKDFIEVNDVLSKYKWIEQRFVTDYRVPDFWNKHLASTDADMLMYLTDDIYLFDNTIDRVFDMFSNTIENCDGLLGLNQDNIEHKVDSAFGVIGINYAKRFPDRKVYCPDYYRFYGDAEMGEYAKSIDKFYYDESIKLYHFHPCTDAKLKDETHDRVRQFLPTDRATNAKRKAKNLLWGRDFTLIERK